MTGDPFRDLLMCTDTFKNTVDDLIPQILDVLNGKRPLISGSPSKNSSAELVFRGIQKKLEDLNGCVEEVRKEIWKR